MRDKEDHSCRTFGLSIRKLLIFELVGAVLSKGHGLLSMTYVLRGWSMEFFVEAFKVFEIEIWYAVDAETMLNIVRSMFDKETIKKFRFVISSWHIFRKDLCSIRTDRCRKTIHFKSLALVWAKIHTYNESNTILINCYFYHG
jgi:hypothetical protein